MSKQLLKINHTQLSQFQIYTLLVSEPAQHFKGQWWKMLTSRGQATASPDVLDGVQCHRSPRKATGLHENVVSGF